MLLELAVDPIRIAEAIDTFPAAYHADFARVRTIGRLYINERPPTMPTVLQLVNHLRNTLVNWGAGKRKAPRLREEAECVNALLQRNLHSALATLGRSSLVNLSVDGRHRLLMGDRSREALAGFDMVLLSTLQTLSEKLFYNNTNVTYPMKALLLISGFMPAFDGNVRGGLKIAGFQGMDKTQFQIPRHANRADGKKVTRLPFILGKCWTQFLPQFGQGIQQSHHPALLQDPGRVFDVLFFKQAGESQSLFRLVTEDDRWHELL